MKTNKLLTTVIVLQGLILIGQWTGGGNYLSSASAQVPDPANRQMQMIEELKSVNTKLDTLVSILQGGDLQVKVAKSEENKGGTPRK
jgi:hypothetical protein